MTHVSSVRAGPHDHLYRALSARLTADPVTPEGTADGTNGVYADRPHDARDAAVLIAITMEPRPHVLLTRRADHLAKHAGQVAFPGGGTMPGEDAVAAALREAYEEVALSPDDVRVVGTLDSFHTLSGFWLTPVLALIPPRLSLVRDPNEVAAIFYAPLDTLCDPANHRRETGQWLGETRHYFRILSEQNVWGITAHIIITMAQRLGLDRAPMALNDCHAA